MSGGSRRPPRLGRWLLSRILSRRHRRFILDDLEEEYRRFQVPRHGRAAADRWYWGQVAGALLSALRRRAPGPMVDRILVEGGHALRRLGRSPGFSLTAVLTLGLGIGAVVAVFSLVNGILLQPLPYGTPDRLVTVHHRAPGMDLARAELSWGTYFHYRERAEALAEIGLHQQATVHLGDDTAAPERIRLAMVTPSFFSVLQRRPRLGRPFVPADAAAGAAEVALISHGLWQRRYGGDQGVVGRLLEINRSPREIVGVLPPDFAYPSPDVDVFLPLTAPQRVRFGGFFLGAVARLAPGVSPGAAKAELERLVPSLADAYGDVTPAFLRSTGFDPVVVPLKEAVVGDVGTALWILLGAAGFVLLIACANVANLTLVRAEYRQGEVAMRVALGAGVRDVAAFFVTESALLGVTGSVLGLSLAGLGMEVLTRLGPSGLPRLGEVGIDGPVLVFTCLVGGVAAGALGLVPLLRFRRRDLPRDLKGERRTTAGRSRQRVRRGLVMVQVALASTLLVGSGLMVRSLVRLRGVDPGFAPGGVLTLNVTLPFRPYPGFEASSAFFRRLVERIETIPGVLSAGAVGDLPLDRSAFPPLDDPVSVRGRPLPEGEIPPLVEYQQFLPGYFETLEIPLRAGRWVAREERAGSDKPVLVSETLARTLFPGEDPLGRRMARGPEAPGDDEGRWMTVVGVVGDVRHRSLQQPPGEIVYLPVLDRSVDPDLHPGTMDVVLRTEGPPTALASTVREIIRDLDPALPVAEVQSLERIVADSTARTRLTVSLLSLAAGAALLLGSVGLYGVVSYTVSRRVPEIGVRIALGARPSDVRRMVVQEAAVLVLGGLLLGMGTAVAASRLLSALLFEVAPFDPLTYVGVTLVLSAVAGLAAWIPARRAVRVDPLRALAS